MSWLDSLQIELSPDEVRIARRSLRSPARLGEEVASLSAGDRSAATSTEPWVAALQCLARMLRKADARSAAVRLLISDHFSRYAVVPWSNELVRDAERLAFARSSFKQVFGAVADTWAISLDDQPAQQPCIACAIDRDLLDSVREICVANKVRLVSALPLLAERYNRYRRRFDERAFCLASLEPRRLTLGFHGAQGWAGVRSVRMHENSAAELTLSLRQEAAATGVSAGGPLYLIGREELLRRAGTPPGWSVTRFVEGRVIGPRARSPATEPVIDKVKEPS